MGNTSRAGLILYRYKIKQDRIDEAIDRKFEKKLREEKVPFPAILPDSTK